jgi:hypothetical protein
MQARGAVALEKAAPWGGKSGTPGRLNDIPLFSMSQFQAKSLPSYLFLLSTYHFSFILSECSRTSETFRLSPLQMSSKS